MNKKKKDCDHFWEIVIDGKFSIKKQKFICMHCGKTSRRAIPILDIADFEKLAEEAKEL